MRMNCVAMFIAALSCAFARAPGEDEITIRLIRMSGEIVTSVEVYRDSKEEEILEYIRETLEAQSKFGECLQLLCPSDLGHILCNRQPTATMEVYTLDKKWQVGSGYFVGGSDILSYQHLVSGCTIEFILKHWLCDDAEESSKDLVVYTTLLHIKNKFIEIMTKLRDSEPNYFATITLTDSAKVLEMNIYRDDDPCLSCAVMEVKMKDKSSFDKFARRAKSILPDLKDNGSGLWATHAVRILDPDKTLSNEYKRFLDTMLEIADSMSVKDSPDSQPQSSSSANDR